MPDRPDARWLDLNLRSLADALQSPLPPPSPDGIWRLAGTADAPQLQVVTAGGQPVSAHSTRGPQIEADRWIDRELSGRPMPRLAIVIGAGLGYALDALIRRSPDVHVLVIEPDPSGAYALLSCRDWRDPIRRRRLLVLAGPDYTGAAQAWRVIPEEPAQPLVLVHPVLAREHPGLVRAATPVMSRVLADAAANRAAADTFGRTYLLNTIENLPAIVREPDVVALADLHRGVPAIVAAAGPSLDDAIASLKTFGTRAVLISVDTALRPLVAHGLDPHFVVAVDPGERNARHLVDLPVHCASRLVAEASVHPRVARAFAGRTFYFSIGSNDPWPWLARHGVVRGSLRAWGSVLISALDLAVRLGCDPILIVGADLAYSGGQPYARGTTYEDDWAGEISHGSRLAEIWARQANQPGALEIEGIGGERVSTLPHLVRFRDRLAGEIAALRERAINCSGRGILLGDGVPLGTLADQLKKHPELSGLRELAERIGLSTTDRRRERASLLAALDDAGEIAALCALAGEEYAARVHAAVAVARSGLTSEPRVERTRVWTPAPAPADGLWPPEQTAALCGRTELAADASPLELEDAPSQALELARALLASDGPLVTVCRTPDVLQTDMVSLPLRLLAGFRQEHRTIVDRLDHAFAAWCIADGPPARLAPFWEARPVPFADARTVREHPVPDTVARLVIATRLVWACTLVDATHPVRRVVAALQRDLERVLTEAPGAATVTLRFATRARTEGSAPFSDPITWLEQVPLAPLGRALTGALFTTDGRGRQPVDRDGGATSRMAVDLELALELTPDGDRRKVTPAFAGWLTPAILTPDPCANVLFATSRHDSSAIVTRLDRQGSYIVDESGRATAAAPWPEPIAAEGAWPDTGTGFAWHSTPDRLLLRRDGRVETYDLPFTPTDALVDGTRLLFSSLSGLWQWSRDGGAARITDCGPLMTLLRQRDSILLAPVPYPPERPRRTRTRQIMTWTPSGLHTTEPGPLGACWSRSTSAGWTAAAFPDADLVLLEHADGRRAWIVCDYPRSVAWAGRSLIAVSRGELLVFPFLQDLLD